MGDRKMGGAALAQDPAPDERVVDEVLAGDPARFEVLMRRHNTRLFRTARAILRDDAEAEDAVQQAYLSAYEHLAQFDGRARVSTWLQRITVNEALRRRGRQRRLLDLEPAADPADPAPSPEVRAAEGELRGLLERVVDELPESYRVVFVLRDVQELSTRETAECLEMSEEAVRVRLHRARRALRDALEAKSDAIVGDLFGFAGERCDRIVQRVLAQIVP